jgi:hypothetical protein
MPFAGKIEMIFYTISSTSETHEMFCNAEKRSAARYGSVLYVYIYDPSLTIPRGWKLEVVDLT